MVVCQKWLFYQRDHFLLYKIDVNAKIRIFLLRYFKQFLNNVGRCKSNNADASFLPLEERKDFQEENDQLSNGALQIAQEKQEHNRFTGASIFFPSLCFNCFCLCQVYLFTSRNLHKPCCALCCWKSHSKSLISQFCERSELCLFAFLGIFCLITLFERKLQFFKNLPKLTIFGIFKYILVSRNVNVARFARNVK